MAKVIGRPQFRFGIYSLGVSCQVEWLRGEMEDATVLAQTSSSSPPPVTLSFKHRGPDLRRTVVVYPWKWVDTETHLPGGRRSLRSFGWEEKHSVYSLVLGDDTKYSDCARRWNGGILRATLLPFILLKAIACINNTGSCEKSNFCSWFGFLFRQNKQMSVFFTANKPSVSWPRVKHLGFSVNHSTFCLTNCLFALAAHVSK